MKLELSKIRLDGGTQPRTALRADVIEEYAESMKAGVQFPLVTVFFDGIDYWLADGFHRLGAARRAFPDQPIEAEVCQGTLADAQWHSYSVNKAHGLRRTNEDKERVVKAALAHLRAANLSNNQLADHCGVSREMVRKYREELAATCNICKSNERVGRDGRKIKTANIGKNQKKGKKAGRKHSPNAASPILGHSLPNPMISLSLPPGNPVMAAATIFNLFDTNFVRTLIAELTQRLKGQDQ